MSFWRRFREDLATKGREQFRFMIQNMLVGIGLVIVVALVVVLAS